MRIDLHAHTSASDGTDSPAELIANARAAGLDVVAITDHDTTSGWEPAARAQASTPGLDLVRGMELSCVGDGEDGAPVPVHLLAYLFDPDHAVFAAERERLRAERVARLRTMTVRMAEAGFPVDPDAVLAAVGDAAGRPHLARALVAQGVVASVDEAFATLLYPGSPYYVEKADTDLTYAVRLVAEAGGVTVVAHARARKRGRLLSFEHIRRLADAGLGGLEVDHPDHNPQDRAALTELANELALVRTGSSDYHGANKTVLLGEFTTDPDEFAALIAPATGVPVLSGH